MDTRRAGRESGHPLPGIASRAGMGRSGPEPAPNYERVEDAELLSACRSGDEAAWDALVSRYERLVFSVAVRNGLSREDAADVTQATFVALLESLDRVRDGERVSFWLMTVARRTAWRAARRRRHELQLPTSMPDSVDPISDVQRTAEIYEALDRLGPPCSDLLTALYFDPTEPDYAAIADRLGRAVGGLGPLRGRCLQRLRLLLEQDAAS